MLGELQAAENLVLTGRASSSAGGVSMLNSGGSAGFGPQAKYTGINAAAQIGSQALSLWADDGDPYNYSDTEATVGIAGSVAQGAAMGAAFGPYGAAIGAGVGLIQGFLGSNAAKEEARKAREARDRRYRAFTDRFRDYQRGEKGKLRRQKKGAYRRYDVVAQIERSTQNAVQQLHNMLGSGSSSKLAGKLAKAEKSQARSVQMGVLRSVATTSAIIDNANAVISQKIVGGSAEEQYNRAKQINKEYGKFWDETEEAGYNV